MYHFGSSQTNRFETPAPKHQQDQVNIFTHPTNQNQMNQDAFLTHKNSNTNEYNPNSRRHFGTDLIHNSRNFQQSNNYPQTLKNHKHSNNTNNNTFSFNFAASKPSKTNVNVNVNSNYNPWKQQSHQKANPLLFTEPLQMQKPKQKQKLIQKQKQKQDSFFEQQECELSSDISSSWKPTVPKEDIELIDTAFQMIAGYKLYIPSKYYMQDDFSQFGNQPVIQDQFEEIQAIRLEDIYASDDAAASTASTASDESCYDMDIEFDEQGVEDCQLGDIDDSIFVNLLVLDDFFLDDI